MLVITGATGFIGRQIVPKFEPYFDLIIVSRDIDKARNLFPNSKVYCYDQLKYLNLSGSTFIHLAAQNSDQVATRQEFKKANVIFLLMVATIARNGGATRLINVSSIHALEPKTNDVYGLSKRYGASRVHAFWPEGAINLYIPSVYGPNFSGCTGFVNHLPVSLRPLLVAIMRLAKPIVSVDRLCQALVDLSEFKIDHDADEFSHEVFLGDPDPANVLYRSIKRVTDLMVSFAAIILGSWAMLLIALYIRLDSVGPAVLAQKRVGRNGKIFTCYKFRTMATGTADVGTHQVPASSVTPAGAFLRKTKLDELPQLLNVLRNEMSLVGPRPCLPVQQEVIERRVARNVLALKPGITGLAQIQGVDMRNPARLAALDDRYSACRTVTGDLLILFRTAIGCVSGNIVRDK